MKCLFCPTNELIVEVEGGQCFLNYKCNQCETSFDYRQNELNEWRCFKKLNGKIFCVYWNATWNKIQVWNTSPRYKEVITLDGDMNINPHNIATKLPMLITFS